MFQRLKGGSSAESTEPRLTLGAFGKHPGWDDHILDRQRDLGLGPDTETLVHVKQALYTSGIGGQIDAGAWEKLEPEKRLAGFDHTFLWLRPGHIIMGQLWSSTDGKGRAKYPMILCIDGEAISPEFMLGSLLPGIDRLQAACKATTSAEQVKRDCRAAQDQLLAVLGSSSARAAAALPPLEARQRFLKRPELGPDSLGLLRILHELNSGPLLSGATRGAAPAAGSLPSRHLRVPKAHDLTNEAFLLWAGWLRCTVPETVPLLLLARTRAEWLDVILGEPASDDFFCFQAATRAAPLATEIPYALAPELKTRLQEIEARFLGVASSNTGLMTAPASKPAPPPAPAAGPAPGSAPAPEKRKSWFGLWFGGGAIVLIAVAAGIWYSTGGLRTTPPAGAPPAKAGPPPAAPASVPTPQTSPAKPAEPTVSKPPEVPSPDQAQPAAEQAYQAAVNAARQALAQMNFLSASNQAFLALKAKSNDATALNLLAEAKTGIAQAVAAAAREQQFRDALNAARTALAAKRFDEVIARAQQALSIKSNDAAAAGLLEAARQQKAALAVVPTPPQAATITQPSLASTAPAPANPSTTASVIGTASTTSTKPTTPPPPVAAGERPPFTNSLAMEFVWIADAPPGGAYIGRHEVTQKQFQAVMGRLPQDMPALGDDLPVANVSFTEAQEFCDRLSKREGKAYALPSHEAWLAAAGLSPSQAGGAWALLAGDGRLRNEVTSWNVSPVLQRPARIGSRGPQANGLCDVFGNVREWVVGLNGEESAGFAYNSSGGLTKQLFLSGATYGWVQPATGLRCLLRENP